MYRLIAVAILALATAVWAQETEDEATETVEESADSESGPEPEDTDDLTAEDFEEIQGFDIDDQDDHVEDEDDVFRPTDAVTYQQSLEYPVDI